MYMLGVILCINHIYITIYINTCLQLMGVYMVSILEFQHGGYSNSWMVAVF